MAMGLKSFIATTPWTLKMRENNVRIYLRKYPALKKKLLNRNTKINM